MEGSGKGPSTPPKKRRSLWRIVAWVVLSLILLVVIATAYVWTHRYALIEDYVRDVLSEQGVEADLSIILKAGNTVSNDALW